LQWRQRWYQGRAEIQNIVNPWERVDPQGTSNDPSIQSEVGFPSGRYRLELFIILEDGVEILSATADFVVAGGAGGANDAEAQIFGNFRFAQSERNTLPVGIIAERFTSGAEAIYVFFDWRQINIGTPWKWRWYLDEDLLVETNTQWSADLSGENYFVSLLGAPTLPDGTYRFEIEMAGILLTENVQAEVGIGQLPVEAFASAEGVQMSGQILDAETGQGIPGALFIVLFSEYSVEDFTWRGNQVLGQARADERGFFQIPALLPRGSLEEPALYSVVVRAEGYLPINADGIPVDPETESPVVIDVEMNRD
jgi:hypothetical protein